MAAMQGEAAKLGEEGGRDPHGNPGRQEMLDMPCELQEHLMELSREKRCVAQLQELVASVKELELKVKEETSDGLKHIAKLEEQLQEEEEQTKVLCQELRRLQEDIEEKEHSWQQHQMEVQAMTQAGVMPEVLEAQLKREELARRGAISWLWTFCLIFVCLELAVLFMLGVAVLYASCNDQEFFYHLLLHVLPEDTYTDLAYFLEDTLSLVSEGVLPY
eukprot:XP_027304358.1 uncharacterized protein LOC113841854 isoform X2 [Anas platyrhynchos]